MNLSRFHYLSFCLLVIVGVGGIAPVQADAVRSGLLQAADTDASGQYTRERFLALQKKPFDPADSRKKALIIGDSHAQDFLNGVLENSYLANYQIRTRYIPFRCQVFLSEQGEQYIKPKDKALCAGSDKLELAKAQLAEADLVILSSLWEEWAAQLLPETIRNLDLRSNQQLVVIGRKEFGKIAVRKYLAMSEDELHTVANKVNPSTRTINGILRQGLGSNGAFVDQHRLICGAGPTCRLFTDDLQLISYDGGHLTKAGAQYVGRLLFEGSILGKL